MRSGCARRSQHGPLMRRLISSASRLVCPPPMTFTKLSPAHREWHRSRQAAAETPLSFDDDAHTALWQQTIASRIKSLGLTNHIRVGPLLP